MILTDTNTLLRSTQGDHLQHPVTVAAVDTLRRRGHTLALAPQNLVEFWAVATRRTEENGLGLSFERVKEGFASLRRDFRILEETPELIGIWEELVFRHQVRGKQVHDARLVAIMKLHLVDTILTLNARDFLRYDINVFTPQSVLAEL